MGVGAVRDFRCAHCNSKTIQCVTYFISEAGDLWRVPTWICSNEECLKKQGATVERTARREYPKQQDTPSYFTYGNNSD